MENYTPEWWNKGELADVVRRSRLVTVEAHGVYLESMECRHRAAVLRDEAQGLRAESFAHRRWPQGLSVVAVLAPSIKGD